MDRTVLESSAVQYVRECASVTNWQAGAHVFWVIFSNKWTLQWTGQMDRQGGRAMTWTSHGFCGLK
jgi:hypothetical protein